MKGAGGGGGGGGLNTVRPVKQTPSRNAVVDIGSPLKSMVTTIVQQQHNQSIRSKLAPSMDYALHLTNFILTFSIHFLCSPVRTNWSNRTKKHDFVF